MILTSSYRCLVSRKGRWASTFVVPFKWYPLSPSPGGTLLFASPLTQESAEMLARVGGRERPWGWQRDSRYVNLGDVETELGFPEGTDIWVDLKDGRYRITVEGRVTRKQLPKKIDLSSLLQTPEQDVGPNEMIPEDFYMASRRSSSRDDKLVIPCHWRLLGAGTLTADITKAQAKTIANYFGAKLPRSVFYIPNINNFLGIGPNQIIVTSLGGGRFVLNYYEKSDQKLHPPDQIDLREAHAPQGDEMIPENFYMASRS